MKFKISQIIVVVALVFVVSCSRNSIEGVYISAPITTTDGNVLRTKLDFRSDGTVLYTGFDSNQKWVKYEIKDNTVIVHENGEDMTLQKDGKDLVFAWNGGSVRYVQQ